MKATIPEFAGIGLTQPLRKGNNATECPFCQDDRSSSNKHKKPFTAHVEEGNMWYKCNHCGETANLTNVEKFKKIKKFVGYERPKSYSKKITDYFEGRGISEYTMKLAGVQEQKRKGHDVLVFPFMRNGILVNSAFRFVDTKDFRTVPKELNGEETNREVVFLGLDDIREDEDGKISQVIICEGLFDYLSLLEAGERNVLSVPMGAPNPNTNITDNTISYIFEPCFKAIWPNIKKFVLMTDNDPNGNFLADILASKLGKAKCTRPKFPEGCKDSNDVLKKYGKEKLRELVLESDPYPINGILKTHSIKSRIDYVRANGFQGGYKCGHPFIDKLWTMKQPYLYTVTGESGSGKSVFLRWYLMELMRYNAGANLHFAMFSPEMRPPEREVAGIVQAFTGKSIMQQSNGGMSEEEYVNALRWCDRHFTIIDPVKESSKDIIGIEDGLHSTLDGVMKHLEALKTQQNLTGYVIDAWNTIDHQQPTHMREDQYINASLEKLIDFNKYYDLACFVVAHPHKLPKQKSGNVERPHLTNISGGQAWKNKTDIGIVCHREPYVEDGQAEGGYRYDESQPLFVYTDKIKFRELGGYGYVTLQMGEYEDFQVIGERFTPEKLDSKGNNSYIQPNLGFEDEEGELPF